MPHEANIADSDRLVVLWIVPSGLLRLSRLDLKQLGERDAAELEIVVLSTL
jgi:hypothetical protein